MIDLKMPGMDGIETARRIRNLTREESTVTIQNPRAPLVIMTTAYSRQQAQECIKQELVDALLLKPIKPSDLFDTIMRLYNQSITEEPRTKPKAAAQYGRLTGHRVLVVEDSELNRDVAVALLEGAGLVVESAENGEKAVDMVTASPRGYYDAVLMDIQMPVMDGYQATKRIKTFENQQKETAEDAETGTPEPQTTIPIIALTAHAMTGEKEKCLEAGMDDYFTKPIDEQDLLRMMLKWIPEQ